jgi:hypothetical protein
MVIRFLPFFAWCSVEIFETPNSGYFLYNNDLASTGNTPGDDSHRSRLKGIGLA